MIQLDTPVGEKQVTALVDLEYTLHDTCWADGHDQARYFGRDLASTSGVLPKGEYAAQTIWAINLKQKRRLASLTGVAVFTDGTWASFRMADVGKLNDEKLEFTWVHIES